MAVTPRKRGPAKSVPLQAWVRPETIGLGLTTIAAIASAIAAFASLEQVKVSRLAARDAALIGRQVEACAEISRVTTGAEFEVHTFLDDFGGGGQEVPPDRKKRIGDALVSSVEVYRGQGLFLSPTQAAAGEQLRQSFLDLGGIVAALNSNPRGMIPKDARDLLIGNINASQARFQLACRAQLFD